MQSGVSGVGELLALGKIAKLTNFARLSQKEKKRTRKGAPISFKKAKGAYKMLGGLEAAFKVLALVLQTLE